MCFQVWNFLCAVAFLYTCNSCLFVFMQIDQGFHTPAITVATVITNKLGH